MAREMKLRCVWSMMAVTLALSASCGNLSTANKGGADNTSTAVKQESGQPDRSGKEGTVVNPVVKKSIEVSGAGDHSGSIGVLDNSQPPPPPPPAALHPDPALVTLTDAQFAGTACPGGTGGTVAFDGNLAHLIVTWPAEVIAQVGPGISMRDGRKQCSLILNVGAPDGWTYKLKEIALTGAVDLEDGVESVIGAQAYFQGQDITAQFDLTQQGALTSEQLVTGALETPVAPMGAEARALVLKIESRVSRLAGAAANARGIGAVRADVAYAVEWIAPPPVP